MTDSGLQVQVSSLPVMPVVGAGHCDRDSDGKRQPRRRQPERTWCEEQCLLKHCTRNHASLAQHLLTRHLAHHFHNFPEKCSSSHSCTIQQRHSHNYTTTSNYTVVCTLLNHNSYITAEPVRRALPRPMTRRPGRPPGKIGGRRRIARSHRHACVR